ncbi:MAG: ABC transporter substrate-binding protein, partial [Chitinophagaceae bacterium]
MKFSNYFFYNEDQNLTTLDPAFTRTQSEIWVVSQMFEGLVEFNDQLESVPCLAKSWNISDSGKVYTFNLRTDVFFHATSLDGNIASTQSTAKKFKAEDVVFSFRRVADPKTASPGAWIFNDKMDLRCFSSHDSVPFPVIALNDSTVQITLLKAFKPFLGILSMNYCYIVPKGLVGPDFRSRPIGTGPFMFR